MKIRLNWLVTLVLVCVAIWFSVRRQSEAGRADAPAVEPAANVAVERATTTPQEPVIAAEVPIQSGKTIDFSSGQAVVKDDAAEKAAIERAVAEMNAAAGEVTFGPKR